MKERVYVAIDLKSFYASVECVDRGLDPLTTNLVVADESRTDKTICLAVSPSLKSYGIPGRPRLFEVVQKVREINAARERNSPEGKLYVREYNDTVIRSDPTWAVDYIVARPRMARYKKVSTEIYRIYLKYVAPEHIHVYSIDEVFMDVTDYLELHKMTARELTMALIQDVLRSTGITATAGIGTNLFLAKVAMDVVAKHIPADADGVRIAELDEAEYRRQLWSHQPITDVWRVGPGIAKKLAAHGMYTMGDVARCSLGKPYEYRNEELLYELFGVSAELLIDHAWGWEPCTMKEIKAYRSESSSLGSGQVLHRPYDFDGARLIVREMTDLLVLELVDKELVTDQIILNVGYDVENLTDPARKKSYGGEIVTDHYGRKIPKHAHGTETLPGYT
ncbi:MAG: DNA methylase, partial [Oscillospiraceae bacterium]|nr:DNA methylase [Oscillospiraceae bacterium]